MLGWFNRAAADDWLRGAGLDARHALLLFAVSVAGAAAGTVAVELAARSGGGS